MMTLFSKYWRYLERIVVFKVFLKVAQKFPVPAPNSASFLQSLKLHHPFMLCTSSCAELLQSILHTHYAMQNAIIEAMLTEMSSSSESADTDSSIGMESIPSQYSPILMSSDSILMSSDSDASMESSDSCNCFNIDLLCSKTGVFEHKNNSNAQRDQNYPCSPASPSISTCFATSPSGRSSHSLPP